MKTRSTATAVMAALVLLLGAATTTLQATEPEKIAYTKASYDLSELKRNVGSHYMIATTDDSERVTFSVAVAKDGEIKDLTYTHNIKSLKQEKVDAYIQKAYMAIMSTEFHPAKKDGQAIEDTLKIEFQLVN